jgi:nucleotide-binding universal stress UspA family protein
MISGYPAKVKSTLEIKYNSVLDSVLDVIGKGDIEIVIMGTKGASGLEEIIIGSNTEKVVRFSPVPVIAIRTAPDVKSITNIVFPNKLTLDQNKLVERVKNLQSFFNSKLHIVWINTPAHFVADTEVKERLEKFVKHYGLANCSLSIRNDINEETGIAAFAREIKADMIAMGTRGRTGLVHFFTGSIAEDVVNHIECPVWTYTTRK